MPEQPDEPVSELLHRLSAIAAELAALLEGEPAASRCAAWRASVAATQALGALEAVAQALAAQGPSSPRSVRPEMLRVLSEDDE